MIAAVAVIFILSMFVVFAGLLVFIWYRRQRVRRAWRSFADQHDFSFVEPSGFGNFSMSGTYEGTTCRVYTETRGSGDDTELYTIYAAPLPAPFPLDLHVREANFVTDIAEFFGGQDIQTGVADLDEAFLFQGDRPDTIRAMVQRDDIQRGFRELKNTEQSVCIRSRTIQLEQKGSELSEETIEEALDTVSTFARRVRAAASEASNDQD